MRRWIRLQQQSAAEPAEPDAAGFDCAPAQSALYIAVPVLVSGPVVPPDQPGESGKAQPVTQQPLRLLQSARRFPPAESIRLELRRGDLQLNVAWPASLAETCVRWRRELLP